MSGKKSMQVGVDNINGKQKEIRKPSHPFLRREASEAL